MRPSLSLLVCLTATASSAPAPFRPEVRGGQPAAGPKVLLYYDMEGTSGVNRPRQVLYPNPEYLEARRFLTGDVNAAIRGLKAGGAGEIVVTDAHGSGNDKEPDVLLDQLDKRASFLFRDHPYEPYLEAPDSSYRAIVCVAMHARAHSPGFMAHTVTVEPAYRVNGTVLTETTIIAISAARFGIPVIMVSGDNVLKDQIKEQFPNAEYAVVKTARGRANADLLPLATAQGNIERAAKAAIQKLATFKPFAVTKPFHFEVWYLNRRQADLASSIAGTQRVDSLTLSYTVPDFAEGYRKSEEMTGMARLEEDRFLVQAVRQRPDADRIMNAYLDLLITNWLEPEKLPKPAAPVAAAGGKKRYHGSN